MNLPVDVECSAGLPICNLGRRHDIHRPLKDNDCSWHVLIDMQCSMELKIGSG